MKQPYFSIVIPTKNRPEFLSDAISSALWQDFDDMEVIVSDNFNDERTKVTVDRFANHPKLKYYRTPHEMNMLDHWEWATTKTSGVYVIVLPDRKLLYQNALKELYKYIHDSLASSINCISYHVNIFDEQKRQMGWNHHLVPSRIFDTQMLIQNFLTEPYYSAKGLDHFFPKTLNSCYKKTYVNEIRSKFKSYHNTAGCTTPDYSSFFINMALNDSVAYFGSPVILSQGDTVSNGRNFGFGKHQAYLASLHITEDELYENLPIRLPIIYNWLTADFLKIQKKVEGNLQNIQLNMENYFYVNYWEVMYKKIMAKIDADITEKMEEEVLAAAQSFNHHIKEHIINRYNSKTEGAQRNEIWKISPLQNILTHGTDYLKANYAQYRIVNLLVKHRFARALNAAGFNY